MKKSITKLAEQEIQEISGGLFKEIIYVLSPIVGSVVGFSIFWSLTKEKKQL